MTYTPPSLPPLGRFMAHRGIHYGWVVAAVTFLTMLVTAGAVGAPGILIGPLKAEFGWNVADISAGFAMRLVLFGLMGPFAAAFMNRFGTRRIAAIALILIGLGTLGKLCHDQTLAPARIVGVVVGFGTGLTAMVLGATVATQWFSKRRGLVVGLLTASAATGQLVFLPALAALTDQFGWRCALAFILVALLIAVVAVLALMRDRPADLGLLPYGATEPPPAVAQRASLWAMMCSPIRTLREASASSTFWVLFGTFFICGASTNGLVQTHFVSLCGDVGILPVMAAEMLAMIGIFDFIGTVGSGWLSDRFDSRWLLFWYFMDCAVYRFFICHTAASTFMICRFLRFSMASTG